MLEGEVAGFASLKGADVLDMLYVHPFASRKGVATQLCEALEKLAAARKATVITGRCLRLRAALFPRAQLCAAETQHGFSWR